MYIAYKLPSAGHIQLEDQLQLATLDPLRLCMMSRVNRAEVGQADRVTVSGKLLSYSIILHMYIHSPYICRSLSKHWPLAY